MENTKLIQNCIETKKVSYRYKDAWHKVKSRRNIGDLSYLFNLYKPASEVDFFEKYVNDGVSMEKDPMKRGRTIYQLNQITKRYMELANSVDFQEAYYNLIYHIIVETYRGFQKEIELMEYIKKQGYNVKKADHEDDANYGIDLVVWNGEYEFFIQVKPISFFIGNNKKDLIQDRLLMIEKYWKALSRYSLHTFIAVYRTDDKGRTQWLFHDVGYNKKKNRLLFGYSDFLNVDGTTKEINGKFRYLTLEKLEN